MKNINKILILILLFLFFIFNQKYLDKKIFENYENKKYKIAVIIHGYAPRSFKYTYKSIQENIINKLNDYKVDVYHYSLISRNNKINSSRKEEFNITINNNDINLLKCNKIETEYQEDLNLYNNITCTEYKNKNMNLNFMRSLNSELECIKRFPLNNYDVDKLLNSIDSIIYGFYIAPPNILYKICKRYKNFPNWCFKNKNKNAEQFLKAIVNLHNISNKESNMYYLKIRANGKSNYYINLINNFNIKDKELIKKKFN